MCNPPHETSSNQAPSESRNSSESNKLTLTVEGVTYDITDFKHPGGSIIKYLATKSGDFKVDATTAFNEFHFRNREKVLNYLKNLPKVEIDREVENEKHKKLSLDFAKLRTELEEAGYFEPSVRHVCCRVLELVLLFVVSFYCFSLSHEIPWFYVPAFTINGIAQGRCGWFMHEGGHFSLTGSKDMDTKLQEIIYGIGCGMSGGWWRNQHNKHHATPQKLKHDVDLDTLPLVAFNKKIKEKVKPTSLLGSWWLYYINALNCSISSQGFFWSLFLHPRHIIQRTKNKTEASSIIFRYVAWFTLFHVLGFELHESMVAYFCSFGFGCMYIFLNFAVSHTHLDVTGPNEYLHWVEYAGLHTTNISTQNTFVTWWMCYLNFQIEHHLFPSMPQFYHPNVSPLVKDLFKRHGIQYDERGYFEAIKDTLVNLHDVGNSEELKNGKSD